MFPLYEGMQSKSYSSCTFCSFFHRYGVPAEIIHKEEGIIGGTNRVSSSQVLYTVSHSMEGEHVPQIVVHPETAHSVETHSVESGVHEVRPIIPIRIPPPPPALPALPSLPTHNVPVVEKDSGVTHNIDHSVGGEITLEHRDNVLYTVSGEHGSEVQSETVSGVHTPIVVLSDEQASVDTPLLPVHDVPVDRTGHLRSESVVNADGTYHYMYVYNLYDSEK